MRLKTLKKSLIWAEFITINITSVCFFADDIWPISPTYYSVSFYASSLLSPAWSAVQTQTHQQSFWTPRVFLIMVNRNFVFLAKPVSSTSQKLGPIRQTPEKSGFFLGWYFHRHTSREVSGFKGQPRISAFQGWSKNKPESCVCVGVLAKFYVRKEALHMLLLRILVQGL